MNLDAMIHHLRGVLCELEAERATQQHQQQAGEAAAVPPVSAQPSSADPASRIPRVFGHQPLTSTGAPNGSEEVSAA